MSIYNDLLTAAQETVTALGFTWGAELAAVGVLVARQAVNRDTLEGPLPLIVLSPGGPEEIENASTGGNVFVKYKIDVSVIGPGESDQAANLDVYLSWRETLRRAFQRWKPSTVSVLWQTLILPGDVFDKELTREDYDFSLLTLLCETCEQAVNS